MARVANVNVSELPEARQAEIAEQTRRYEQEAAEWQEFFRGVDERVLTPVMAALADELSQSGRWAGRQPKTEPRLSGSGVKTTGQFKIAGGEEGQSRPMDASVELYPTTNRRFIAYVDVGGKVERKTFEVSEFESDPEQSDERLRSWLNGQFDRHIRRKAYH